MDISWLGACRTEDKSTAKNPLWPIFWIIFIKNATYSPKMIKKMDSKRLSFVRPTSVRQALSLHFTYPPQMGGLTHLNDHVRNRKVYNDPRDVPIYITRNHRRDPLEKIEEAFGIPKYSTVSTILLGVKAR